MLVRAATIDDYRPIAQLHADSWRTTYRGIFKDEYLDEHVLHDRIGIWRERLTMPKGNQHVLIAEEHSSLLGFICAYGNEDTRWGTFIDNLHVVSARKRQGIGRRLLTEIARWSNHHYPDAGLYLGVLAPNTAARRFYEALGATNRESCLWEPPGGGEVVDLRYAWPSACALLDRVA